MIHNCEHLPKASVGGFVLSVCSKCRASNIELFHSRDSAIARHPAKGERRRPLYLVLDLREPTKEDLSETV